VFTQKLYVDSQGFTVYRTPLTEYRLTK